MRQIKIRRMERAEIMTRGGIIVVSQKNFDRLKNDKDWQPIKSILTIRRIMN